MSLLLPKRARTRALLRQCAGAPDARPDALEGEAWSSPKIDRGVDWFWVARARGGQKMVTVFRARNRDHVVEC